MRLAQAKPWVHGRWRWRVVPGRGAVSACCQIAIGSIGESRLAGLGLWPAGAAQALPVARVRVAVDRRARGCGLERALATEIHRRLCGLFRDLSLFGATIRTDNTTEEAFMRFGAQRLAPARGLFLPSRSGAGCRHDQFCAAPPESDRFSLKPLRSGSLDARF